MRTGCLKSKADSDDDLLLQRCSASFTGFHLLSFTHGSPAELRDFLSLTPSLESFTLGAIGICGYSLDILIEKGIISYRWTFEHLRALLLQHRSTLRELRVYQLGPRQEYLSHFNLQPFESLRTLQLCTLALPPPERACDLWLTPNLERIVFDSSYIDSQQGIIWYLNDNDVAWFAAFSEIAAERKRAAVSRLSVIELICPVESHQNASWVDRAYIEARIPSVEASVRIHGFDFIWQRAVQITGAL
jgi:hypothetical protein